MKHLDPKQLPADAQAMKPRKSARNWLLGALLAAVGAGAGLTMMFPTDSSDSVSASEVQSRQAAFGQMEALSIALVPREEIDAALDEMQLSSADRAALRDRLEAGNPGVGSVSTQPANREVRLARVTVWDTHSQDGDIVAVRSAGYHREVFMTNAPQQLVIPVDSAAVEIVGVRDGGGGITLGAQGAANSVLMPVMTVGQTVSLPVSY